MDEKNIADIFEEENKNKKTRLVRKMEMKKEQEEKIYNDFINEQKNKTTPKETTEELDLPKASTTIYHIFFAFITVLSFFISIGYTGYVYLKHLSNHQLIQGAILIGFTFFYMLSMFSNKIGLKKFFSIITSLMMLAFIAFQLFIV